MKRLILMLLAALPLCGFADAEPFSPQTLAAAAQLREAALHDDQAYEWVSGLVTDVGPRFSGTEGNRKAVAWAQQRLKLLGFSKVHTEDCLVPHWVRGDIRVEIAGTRPQPLVAVALGGSVATPANGIEAPVLMLASYDELKTRPLEEIKDKIIFFNQRMERRADGSGYGDAVKMRALGPAEAGRRGALAVVIRSVGTDHARIGHTGATRYDDAAPKIPAAALSSVDADLLETRIKNGDKPRLRVVIHSRDLPKVHSANVIGEIPGETGEIVLLGAHLDSWDITPGANDDGAGTAIVVDAARMIGTMTRKPHRTIRVVLFANEEFGTSGSLAYVKAHAAELAAHTLAMEADFGSGAVQSLQSGVAESARPLVAQILQVLAPLNIVAGDNGKAGGADIGHLFERGVPTLGPRQDGTLYFDVHHTVADTLDKIDQAGLKQNVAVYAVSAYLAAETSSGFGRVPVTSADP